MLLPQGCEWLEANPIVLKFTENVCLPGSECVPGLKSIPDSVRETKWPWEPLDRCANI